MKLGIVSDLHCNAAGLRYALGLMGEIDELICLGDSIYEYRFSNEVVQLLKDRDAALGRQTVHTRHLETLLAEHGRVIAERDAQLATINAAREREVAERSRTIEELQGRVSALERDVRSLNGALSAQERIIAYREGIRWWIKLPWVRARRWIDRW